MALSVAVLICSRDLKRAKDLMEAIQSVRNQSYCGQINIVVFIDGNANLYRLFAKRYEKVPEVKVISTGKEEPLGLARARTLAISSCYQDVICFLDDDAIADTDWIEEIVKSFGQHACVMIAGKIVPLWRSDPPKWLTPAFFWLVGGTGSIFKEQESYVRSGFGSNLSCMREALVKVGPVASSLGLRGSTLMQAEDADLGLRVREVYGKSVIYNPRAVVFHKVGHERLRITYLLKRAYFQGKSKAVLFLLHRRDFSSLDTEYNYLRTGILNEMISTATRLLGGSDIALSLKRLCFSLCVTGAVVLGFFLHVISYGLRSTYGSQKLEQKDAN